MSFLVPASNTWAAIEQLVRHRRATVHITGEAVPAAIIESVGQNAAEAPSPTADDSADLFLSHP